MYKSKKKKAQEKQEKLNNFLTEYKELSNKHKIDIGAQLKAGPNGIIPQLFFKFLDEDAGKNK
jgi:hypothetical protein